MVARVAVADVVDPAVAVVPVVDEAARVAVAVARAAGVGLAATTAGRVRTGVAVMAVLAAIGAKGAIWWRA